jgi:hypothetical protein
MVKLAHVGPDVVPQTVFDLLQRDGAVVVEGILSSEVSGALNQELDALIRATAPGLRHPAHERMVEFYGLSTVRV